MVNYALKNTGALISPKGMIKYSNKPYLMRKAVFHLCLGLILIW